MVSRASLYPNPQTPEAKEAFDAAYAMYSSGNFGQADQAFASFISGFPYTELTDRARFVRGEIAFAEEKYKQAIIFYKQSYSEIKSPNVLPKAHFKAAMAMAKLGRGEDVLAELSLIERSNASNILKLRMDSLGFSAALALGKKTTERVLWSLRLLDDYASGATLGGGEELTSVELVPESTALEDVRAWIDDANITLADISSLPVEDMKGKKSGGYLDYKYAIAMHTSGDFDGASKLIKNYISRYPKHEYYQRARLLAAQMGGLLGDGAGIKIGAMLPLSGKYAVYGQSVLNGLECAIGVYEPCSGPSGIEVIVRDTELSGASAETAVDELADEGVIAIVGPLLSRSAIAAAGRAQERGVPTISLSQMDGFAEAGDYTFRNFVTPDSEISTLVDYVFSNMRLRRFFVLYPENKKGVEYRDLFTNAVKKWGGKVVGKYPYAPNQMEFASELRGRGMAEQVAGLTSTGESYDAIFIPDSFKAVGYIIPTLAMMGVRKAKYLGISRWNDAELVERGGEFVDGAVFTDAFFKSSSDPVVYGFVGAFKKAYGIDPTLLEAVAYDTMRMMIQAIQLDGVSGRQAMKDALLRTTNFAGATGRTSFDATGDAKRTLQVLTVKNSRIQQIN
jgi:ABC-type branched-subunit amino acid transport system substrate-binding protein